MVSGTVVDKIWAQVRQTRMFIYILKEKILAKLLLIILHAEKKTYLSTIYQALKNYFLGNASLLKD